MGKKSVFGFNDISKELPPDRLRLLYNLYHRYHRQMWYYKKAHQAFKKRDLVLSSTSAVIITGGLAGTAVFLPAVAIGACGIVLGVITKKKNYPRKIELTRYAYTNFEKVLHRLKAYLRGEPFCQQTLVHELNILEDNVTDLCPAIDFAKYSCQYEKVYDLPKCILS